ncbi:methyl-accepting chemotaxis protein [Cohnella sp. GCM10012308]|uniref:methyl-accepting chemotaxis protein n=1 Tax=Cohnella sp. GCM10012308 TaxID=3317329 RepID=UPI00360DFF3D
MSLLLLEKTKSRAAEEAPRLKTEERSTQLSEIVPVQKVEPVEFAKHYPSVVLAEWIRSCPQVSPEQTCGEMAELFRRRHELECVAVVKTTGEPAGIVMRHRFFKLIGSLYGMPLFADKPVTKLMDSKAMIAETDLSPQELIDRAMSRDEERIYDAVMMTSGGAFTGVLTVSDMLQLSRLLRRELAGRQMSTVRGAERMLRDIRGSVDRLAGEASVSRTGSLEIAELAEHGQQDLTQMLGLFRLWTETADRQASSVDELLARVSDTVGIAKIIAQLADQCNLLAINAQIEAARAGSHGLGFSVVAQEVRQLADQTKSQASQIHEQLSGMAASAAAAAAHVREGKEGADRGMLQVHKTEDTFNRLWTRSSENAKGTEHLAAASREASVMSEQIAAQVAKLAAQMNESPEEKY